MTEKRPKEDGMKLRFNNKRYKEGMRERADVMGDLFKKLYKHLKNRGFDVYAIGQHEGLCRAPYVVVRERGEQPFLTGLVAKWVDFMAIVPEGHYSELGGYIADLRAALKDYAGLRDTHIMTPPVIDPYVKGYTVNLTYQIIARRMG